MEDARDGPVGPLYAGVRVKIPSVGDASSTQSSLVSGGQGLPSPVASIRRSSFNGSEMSEPEQEDASRNNPLPQGSSPRTRRATSMTNQRPSMRKLSQLVAITEAETSTSLVSRDRQRSATISGAKYPVDRLVPLMGVVLEPAWKHGDAGRYVGALRRHIGHLQSDVDLIGRCFVCGELGRVYRRTCCNVQRHLECELAWQRSNRLRWELVVSAGVAGPSMYRRAPRVASDAAMNEFVSLNAGKLYHVLPCSLCKQPWQVVPAEGDFRPLWPSERDALEDNQELEDIESMRGVVAREDQTGTTRILARACGYCFQDVLGCSTLADASRFLVLACAVSLPISIVVALVSAILDASIAAMLAAGVTAFFLGLGIAFAWRMHFVAQTRRELQMLQPDEVDLEQAARRRVELSKMLERNSQRFQLFPVGHSGLTHEHQALNTHSPELTPELHGAAAPHHDDYVLDIGPPRGPRPYRTASGTDRVPNPLAELA